jgi:hypothetical protein
MDTNAHRASNSVKGSVYYAARNDHPVIAARQSVEFRAFAFFDD